MKKENWIYAILAVVVLGGLIWPALRDRSNEPMPEGEASEESQNEVPEISTETENNGVETSGEYNVLKGVLQLAVEGQTVGNLTLVMDNGINVPISTARDFSALVGKNVEVTIDGSLEGESFRMINIVEAEAE